MNHDSIVSSVKLCAALMATAIFGINARGGEPMPVFSTNSVILFQGDSITHGGRGGDPNHAMGHGYAFIIAAKYGSQLAERNLTFLNRGVSGNGLKNLLERWQRDTIALKPDVLSILIGVNDRRNPPKVYEEQYDQLLDTTIKALPNVKLVIIEPFMVPLKENISAFQEIAKRLADKYHAPLVRLQHVFEEADKRANPRGNGKYWIWDTVHPTYSGHQLIADEWVRTVEAFYGQSK